MDWQTILSAILTLMLAVSGLILRALWERINEQRESLREHTRDDGRQHDQIWEAVNTLRAGLSEHKVIAEQRFAKGGELERLEERLDSRLDRIEGKLDKALATA